MKLIFLIALFAAIGPPPKEPTMFLGHALYKNTNETWCVIRVIKAVDHKQADSLFQSLVDSCVKADKAILVKKTYDVWELEEYEPLQLNHDHKLKPFSP